MNPTLPRAQAAAIADAFLPRSRLGNRYNHYYVRTKLATDPLFPGALTALRGSTAPLLDLGCGLGLLAHALRADGQTLAYTGVDIDPRKIAGAHEGAARSGLRDASFAVADLTQGLPSHAGSVAILDVLQYVDAQGQLQLLDTVAAMLTPGARLVMRAALASRSQRGIITRAGDWFAHVTGWMQTRPEHYPDGDALRARLIAAGLHVEAWPLNGFTPFNHWMIVAERRSH